MKNLILMALSLLLFSGASASTQYYYVDVEFESMEQIKELSRQGFDVAGVNYELGTISLILPKDEISRVRSMRVISRKAAALRPDDEYKTPKEIEEILFKVEEEFPHLAGVEVIGSSIESRDIYAIKLTARFAIPAKFPKPTIVIDALHHAREVMTPEVALDIIEYLTTRYKTDLKVREWMDDYVIWVVPMVNPDGNNKVWTSSSMWRKNTRNGYGVDINRNYPYDWGACNGSSGSTFSDTYRGESAGSEPETKALMDLIKSVQPAFNISYHSYSEIVIYPFGCSPKKIPSEDLELYEGIGKELAKKLKRDSGSGSYTAGTSYELLYDVDGGSIDWMYAENNAFSYVIEVNSSSQGFQPSYKSWRDSTVQRQRAGWQYILDRMKDVVRVPERN